MPLTLEKTEAINFYTTPETASPSQTAIEPPQNDQTDNKGDYIEKDPQDGLNALKTAVEIIEQESIFAKFDPTAATDPRLTALQFRIYAIYCTHRNNQRNDCFQKLDTIAAEAGCSRRAVIDAKKKLIELGYIKATERRNKQTGRRTSDLITFPTLKTKQPTSKTVSKPTQNSGKQYKTKPKTQQQQTQPRNYWDQEQQKRPQPQQWQGLQPIQKIPKQTFTNLIQNTKQQLTKTRDPTPI